MSYCRWSSMNHQCDLYVYEDVNGGWTIHVAAQRTVEPVPPLGPLPQSDDKAEQDRFFAAYRAQAEHMRTATFRPIGLPHDGETFNLPGAAECADKVEALMRLGYRCPVSVIPTLRSEAEEYE